MSHGNTHGYESYFGLSYSPASSLNTIDVHYPPKSTERSAGYWIVFIHGGAWRDPTQTSRDFDAALEYLPATDSRIAGLISINYRLSPHPDNPAEPGSDDEKARSARHPTHIEDVLTAISWIQYRFDFQNNYILSGHSAGAMLAFQAVMGGWSSPRLPAETIALPVGIVGICGIYDLSLLVRNHPEQPLYRSFVEEAFGKDETRWAAASPVTGKFHNIWPEGKAAVIAPSRDDELVEFTQSETMSDHLWAEKRSGRRDVIISLTGKHNDVVYEGEELARALIKCLDMVS
jgi:kynurenine formamidase